MSLLDIVKQIEEKKITVDELLNKPQKDDTILVEILKEFISSNDKQSDNQIKIIDLLEKLNSKEQKFPTIPSFPKIPEFPKEIKVSNPVKEVLVNNLNNKVVLTDSKGREIDFEKLFASIIIATAKKETKKLFRGGINIVRNENPSGSVNGSNTIFTLAYTPKTNTEQIYVNGMRFKNVEDYTISGGIITLNTAPPTNSIILVDYERN